MEQYRQTSKTRGETCEEEHSRPLIVDTVGPSHIMHVALVASFSDGLQRGSGSEGDAKTSEGGLWIAIEGFTGVSDKPGSRTARGALPGNIPVFLL